MSLDFTANNWLEFTRIGKILNGINLNGPFGAFERSEYMVWWPYLWNRFNNDADVLILTIILTISWHAGIQSHCKPISDLWENCSKPIASSGGAVLAMNARIWRKHSNFSYLQVVRYEYLGTSENGESYENGKHFILWQ